MTFEFNNQLLPQSLVEIEELGDFGLEMSNDEGFYCYMAVRCLMGTAVIATCGPAIPDIEMLPSGFSMSLLKMDFKEDKVSNFIDKFLNDNRRKITDAKLLDFEEALNNFGELKDYLLNLSEGTF